MAKIKYLEIYNDLKNKIDNKVYAFQLGCFHLRIP